MHGIHAASRLLRRLGLAAALTWAGLAMGAARASETVMILPGDAEVPARVGQRLTVTLRGPEGASYWAEGLPDGLALDAASGRIEGAVGRAGTYGILVAASSDAGLAYGTLKIIAAGEAPSSPASGAAASALPAAAMAAMSSPSAAPMQSFFRDGKSDILWRNAINHELVIWRMDGTLALGANFTNGGIVGADWRVAAVGDFDGDGYADILWRSIETGQMVMWFMVGPNVKSFTVLPQMVGLTWEVAGAGDFNGDGRADILWRSIETGQLLVWFMNGAHCVSFSSGPIVDLTWRIAGVGNFTGAGNGKAGILWRCRNTRALLAWHMDGAAPLGFDFLSSQNYDAMWEVMAVGDYTGNGKADIWWRHRGTHQMVLWQMDGIHCINASFGSPAYLSREWETAALPIR